MKRLNILCIEAFFGGSHRAFAEGLQHYSKHQIDLFTLPARFWKWRMRGAALYLADQIKSPESYDLLCASNILSLADLKALWGRRCPPSLVYFHENQLLYPLSPGEQRDFHYGFIDLTSALTADKVLFNSHYHRNAFLDELPRFISHFPDIRPHWTLEPIREKSQVLYPGIEPLHSASVHMSDRTRSPAVRPLILWNHRWEHDKNPELFFETLFKLSERKANFSLAVVGEQYKKAPHIFQKAKQALSEHLIQFGYLDSRNAYYGLLEKADIVVSSSNQENFGLSMAEAMHRGCFPLAPHRLSYPELIPQTLHSACLYREDSQLEEMLLQTLHTSKSETADKLSGEMERFTWPQLIHEYDRIFEELAHTTIR